MFFISLPLTVKVGDTVNCRINREPARVTWKDWHTLVIEPADERAIFHSEVEGDLRTFMCGDAGVPKSKGYVEVLPDGVVVHQGDRK